MNLAALLDQIKNHPKYTDVGMVFLITALCGVFPATAAR